jgi:hypothetical protein
MATKEQRDEVIRDAAEKVRSDKTGFLSRAPSTCQVPSPSEPQPDPVLSYYFVKLMGCVPNGGLESAVVIAYHEGEARQLAKEQAREKEWPLWKRVYGSHALSFALAPDADAPGAILVNFKGDPLRPVSEDAQWRARALDETGRPVKL